MKNSHFKIEEKKPKYWRKSVNHLKNAKKANKNDKNKQTKEEGNY